MSDQPAETPDLRAAAVQGVRWTAVTRGLVEIVTLASMIVLARLIAPAEFGRFAVALIPLELAALVPSEGIGSALVQRTEVRREHLQAGFALALVSGVILAVLILGAATLLADPLFGEQTAELIRLSAPMCLIAACSAVPLALLRRRLAFRRLAVVDIVNTIVRAGACVALALAGLDGAALVLGTLAAAAAAGGVAWASAPPPLPILRRAPARDVLSYGLPASLASLSWVGFRNCDYAIVAARMGALQAGFYFRAYQLAVEYQKKVSLVISQVGFPVLARSANAGEMASIRRQMVRLLAITLFPLLAILAVVAPLLIPWLFGPAWTPAVLPTQILAAGGAATLVIDTVGATLMASGRPRALLGFGIAHFAVYATAVFFAAPLGLGAVAAAATVVHIAFVVVAYALMLRGSIGDAIGTLWNDVAAASVSCLALVAVAVPVKVGLVAGGAPAVLVIIGVTCAAAPAYFVALRVLFPTTWRTLGAFARLVIPQRAWRIGRRMTPAGNLAGHP